MYTDLIHLLYAPTVAFSIGSSFWLLILAAIGAAAAAWWTYRKTIPDLPGSRRGSLGLLRFFSILIISLLLFEPVLERSRSTSIEPLIGLLIDQSESMALADSLAGDDQPGTEDMLATIKRATAGMDTWVAGFGSHTDVLAKTDTITFTRDRTDLATALSEAASALADRPLAGIVLASDGLYNTGANPLHIAERFPVPIHTIALGDPTDQIDVRIEGVVTNELTYSGLDVPVLVRIRNEGVATGPLEVNLFSGETLLTTLVGTLPPSGSETSLEARFEAGEAGRKTIRVVISRYPGEVTYRNNETRLDFRVLDQKKSVLLIAASPSPDVSAISRLLSLDETVSMTVRTQRRDGSWHEGDFPPDIRDFDLILAVGFPGISSTPADIRSVADAVEAGTPLLYVHQRTSSLSRLQESFGTLLPMGPRDARPSSIQGTIQQTSAAASHAVFDIQNRRDVSRWRRLPPISLPERPWEVRPGATVLATSEVRGIALPDPVIAVYRQGRIKTAAIAAYGLWRWTLVPEDLEQDALGFEQLLSNMVQWLFAADDDRLIRVEPEQSSFSEGDAVRLNGQVYDEALRPLSDAAVSVQLTSPEGQLFPYEMQARGNGRYVLDTGVLPAGTYQYKAVAQRDEQVLGTDSGVFSIGQRSLEFRRTRADIDLLGQIASRSGGVMVQADDPEGLEAAIRNSTAYTPRTEIQLEEFRLWQRLPSLFLVLTLLSLEWFFRKRWGLV